MLKDLTEIFSGDFREAGIDSENKILSGIVIAGTRKSQNGYEYTHKAFETLTRLASGSKVFLNHPSETEHKSRQGVRDLSDWMGTLQNARRSGDIVSGSFHVRESYWDLVKDIVNMEPENVGFSINAQCRVFLDKTGRESVTDIAKLHSVDLVASASLTKTLFESQQQTVPQDATVKAVGKDSVLVTGDFGQGELPLADFNGSTPKVGDEIQVVKEGILTDKIQQDEIRQKADRIMWKASDLINNTLRDKDVETFAERRKKVVAILDDLEKELAKIMPKIKPEKGESTPPWVDTTEIKNNIEEEDMTGLSKNAVKGLEAIGKEAERKKSKTSILDAIRTGFGAKDESDDPIVQKAEQEMKEAEKQREKRESRPIKVTDADKAEVLSSIG